MFWYCTVLYCTVLKQSPKVATVFSFNYLKKIFIGSERNNLEYTPIKKIDGRLFCRLQVTRYSSLFQLY